MLPTKGYKAKSSPDIPSSAVKIPRRNADGSLYGLPRDIVGSPEQLHNYQGTSSAIEAQQVPSNTSESISPLSTRPTFSRSVSSSAMPPNRSSGTISRFRDFSSSLLRMTHHDRPSEREWSVFGQLMEIDDPLSSRRAPGTLLSRQGVRFNPPRPSVSPSGGLNPVTSAMPEPQEAETVQSPVDDSNLSKPSVVSSEDDGASTSREGSSPDESDSYQADAKLTRGKRPWYSLPTLPSIPPVYRNILKCSVAYFIGSLFTFSPYLSGFIADLTNYGPGESAPSPSGHMVATVAVYYNPAKTLGAMVEADLFCMMGLLFAATVALSSMTMFWFFETRPGWEWLADVLVLSFIGLGMSGVAWMKVWMAKPTFNTACSMTAIILFIVGQGGGLQTLLQVSFIVLVGATISNAVCFLLWPQRATNNLQATMTKTLQSFSTLLGLITETFLLEEPGNNLSREKIQRAVESHQASFTSLKKSLVEAQSESMFGGPGKASGAQGEEARKNSGQAYEDAIASLTRLGQHLNGLRSGTTLQYDLIKAHRDGKVMLRNLSIKRQANPNLAANGKARMTDSDPEDPEQTAMLQAAALMFGDLMDDLGPPLKALSNICTSSLKHLHEAFVKPRSGTLDDVDLFDVQQLSDDIERALFTFESTSNHAVMRLYRSQNMSGTQSRASVNSAVDDNQVLIGSDSEHVFLVYYFIFTLQEFAKELLSLVDAMGRICTIESARAARGSWWKRLKNGVGSMCSGFRRGARHNAREKLHKQDSLSKRISTYFVPDPHRSVSFPKVKPHAPNTILTPDPSKLTFLGRIKLALWALGARLKEQDLKYAVKAGMATAILAAPAFLETTRPVFIEYRGEWALISFFVVISPTIGATNFLGVHRVLGTLFGAATAVTIWSLAPENPYVLSIFGFFYSIPCFYYIVAKPVYATTSRFVLLTYNLTCLYCYNLRQKDISVTHVAFHRAVAVTVGVVWAALVSRYWWPIEARRVLGRALGDFCLNIGWLYTRLVAFNSYSDSEGNVIEDESHESSVENGSLLPSSQPARLTNSIQEFMAMELHLQIKLIELQGLLAQTQHEPRLKGPFPVATYRSILTSLQAILDRLHSMRCVTSRKEWHTTVRRDFILPVNKERREMVGNIILYFSVLAAAFRTKTPLPPYLPPAERARERLVDAIRKLDVVRNRDVKGSRQLLFFAYAVTMKGVIQELDFLGHTLQEAFGVIGQSTEDFEELFGERERMVNIV